MLPIRMTYAFRLIGKSSIIGKYFEREAFHLFSPIFYNLYKPLEDSNEVQS